MSNEEITKKLNNIAESYKRDLSWIAAIHVVLRSKEGDVIQIANKLLIYPDIHLQVQNFSPAQSRKIRERMIESFNIFGNHATETPSENTGSYLNKSAILYTDAILQAFLDKIFDVMIEINKLPSNTQKNQSINSKLRSMDSILSVSSIINAKHVRFISQLRHIITHNYGFVDHKFLSISTTSVLWDENIWHDKESFLKDYELNKQLTLSIEKVLIPYIENAIKFIDEYISEACKII